MSTSPLDRFPLPLRAMIAEFIGTFALCFFGCAAIALTAMEGAPGSLVTVALAHGLALVVFVGALAHVSGANFNPAVSVGLVLAGKLPPVTAACYVVAQLLAAACAVGMLVLAGGMFPPLKAALEATSHGATLGAMSTGDGASMVGVILIEALMTFALMFVILMGIVQGGGSGALAGILVGGTVGACIVGFGPLTGASMNPARSFGPALYGHWDMHAAYWIGPVIGSGAAALLARVMDRGPAA